MSAQYLQQPPQHIQYMAKNQSEWGTTTPDVGEYTYDYGTIVEIKAIPAEGNNFVFWTGDVADSTSVSTTLTMIGDKTVIANYKIITYTISGTVTGADGINVTLSVDASDNIALNDGGSYSFTVEHGGSYTVTPSKDDYYFPPQNIVFDEIDSDKTQNFSLILPVPIISVSKENVTSDETYIVEWINIDVVSSYSIEDSTNYYRVKANNNYGSSGWSNTVKVSIKTVIIPSPPAA